MVTNSSSTVGNIAVNFNDGVGYRTITPNQLINISYVDTGNKTWVFRLTLTNGNTLYSHTEMNIAPEPNSYGSGGTTSRFPRPGGPIALTADAPWNGQTAQGWITVDYASPTLKLTKPLIVVEGFDAGHLLNPENQFGWSSFKTFTKQLTEPQNFSQLTNLLNGSNQEYNIIYVDWARGTDFLQRNALLLERVIRWVNEQKALDGSAQPNVVLGQSMGGVISRWALRDMEIKGLLHDTRLFVSWDAPHLGANVPVSFQHLARHANSLYVSSNGPLIVGAVNILIGAANYGINFYNAVNDLYSGSNWNEIGSLPSNSTILSGLNLMDVPAARQMLINRINLNTDISNGLHAAWQTELKTLGYPLQSRNIAISNGSECGINQGFLPYADLLSIIGNGHTRFLGDLLGEIALPILGAVTIKPQLLLGILPGKNSFSIDFNCKAQPVSGTPYIYKGKITYSKKLFWLVDINTTITDRQKNADPSVLAIDGSPGGYFPVPINLQNQDYKKLFYKYNIVANNITAFDFVPTPSALDIGGGQGTLTLADYNRSYIGGAPPAVPLNSKFINFTTAFNRLSSVTGQVINNEQHIQISPRNGNFVAEELNRLRVTDPEPKTDCSAFCSNLAISGNAVVCTTQTYTVPANNGATYTWRVTNPAIVTLTPNGNSIQVMRNNGANGVTNLIVTIHNPDCGNDVTTSLFLEIGIPVIPPFMNNSYVKEYHPGFFQGVVTLQPGYHSSGYKWTVNNKLYPYSTLPTFTFSVANCNGNPGIEDYTINVQSTNACGGNSSCTIFRHICKTTSLSLLQPCGLLKMAPTRFVLLKDSIYINKLNVKVVSLSDDDFAKLYPDPVILADEMVQTVSVYDLEGNLAQEVTDINAKQSTIDMSGLPEGNYNVVVKGNNEYTEQQTYKFIVTKTEQELAEEIATDNYTIPTPDEADRKEVLKQQLFKELLANNDLLNTSTILQNFLATKDQESYGFIRKIMEAFDNSDTALVQTLLNNWIPQNQQDQNCITYFNLYLHLLANYSFTYSDIDNLYNLGNMCPLKDGEIIYAARSLYNFLTESDEKFDHACDGLANRAARKKVGSVKNIRHLPPTVKVYPNPAKGSFNLDFPATEKGQSTILLTDIIGNKILQKTLSQRLNNISLPPGTTSGIYVLHIVNQITGKQRTQKIVIKN